MDQHARQSFGPFTHNQFRSQGYQRYRNGRQQMPYAKNNHILTSDLYHFSFGRLISYVDRYMTRYHDLYLDQGRQEDAKALSKEAVQELTIRTKVTIHQAGVMILCDHYTRCNLPQGAAARTELTHWAEYLYLHLSPTTLPNPEQQLYEQNMMRRAEEAGFALWQAYKAFSRDPLDWVNRYVQAENLRVYEELVKAGEAAHRLWLLNNQPDRMPPQRAVQKLSPLAKEFLFVKVEDSKPPTSELASSRAISVDDSSISGTDIDRTASGTPSSSSSSFTSGSDNARGTHAATHSKTFEPSQPVSVSAALELEFSTTSDEATSQLSEIETMPDSHNRASTSPSLPSALESARKEILPVQNSQSSDSAASASSTVPESTKTHSRQSSISVEQIFHRTIRLFSSTRQCLPATALLDTGCEAPNWVSYKIVQTLGEEKKIFKFQKSKSTPALLDANGEHFKGIGTINLSWQFYDPQCKHTYKTWENDEFYVSPSSHIQVIFGAPWLRTHNLIQVNEDSIMPLTPDQKMSPEMKKQVEESIRARDARKREADAERVRHEQINIKRLAKKGSKNSKPPKS